MLYVLYPWVMILFFIVAGISSRCYLETHSIRDFVRTRTRKLLVPSTIGLLLFGWLQGWLNMTLAGGFDGIPDTIPKVAVFVGERLLRVYLELTKLYWQARNQSQQMKAMLS